MGIQSGAQTTHALTLHISPCKNLHNIEQSNNKTRVPCDVYTHSAMNERICPLSHLPSAVCTRARACDSQTAPVPISETPIQKGGNLLQFTCNFFQTQNLHQAKCCLKLVSNAKLAAQNQRSTKQNRQPSELHRPCGLSRKGCLPAVLSGSGANRRLAAGCLTASPSSSSWLRAPRTPTRQPTPAPTCRPRPSLRLA